MLKNRLKKLEARYSTDELILYIPSVLDDSIPEGAILKRIFSGKTSTDQVLTYSEYEDEIHECNNLITIGEANAKQE